MKTRISQLLVLLAILIAGQAFAQSCSAQASSSHAQVAAAQSGATSNSGQNLVATIKQNHDLMMFGDLLRRTKLSSVLEGKGPYTVFAPNASAFNSCSSEDQQMMNDNKMLASMLKYHIISGQSLTLADLQGMNGKTLKTMNGMELAVTVQDGKVLLDHAVVLSGETQTANGNIFIIDTVNMPKMPSMEMQK